MKVRPYDREGRREAFARFEKANAQSSARLRGRVGMRVSGIMFKAVQDYHRRREL